MKEKNTYRIFSDELTDKLFFFFNMSLYDLLIEKCLKKAVTITYKRTIMYITLFHW